MTAEGKHSCGVAMSVVYNTLHVARAIWKCWLEWQEKSRMWHSNKKSKQSLLAQKYQVAFVTIFREP